MRAVCQAAQDLIKKDEACALLAYPDPGTGGAPWTIGYGHTGPEVHRGLLWTYAQVEDAFEADIAARAAVVEHLIGAAPTTNNQFGAMVSLAYNIGLGNFGHSSVLRYHLGGDYAAAAQAFALWNRAAGRILAGLVRRRAEERALYQTPDR